MREAVAKENRDAFQLERSPRSRTGFVNVIEVKGKYQARLQVPGDGRGGCTKRKQYSLPGLFDTPEEAAVLLAAIKRDMKASTGGKLIAPPKIDKPHKPRTRQTVPKCGITSARTAASVASGHGISRADVDSDAAHAICGSLAASDAAAW